MPYASHMGRGSVAENVLYGPAWARSAPNKMLPRLPDIQDLQLQRPGYFEDFLGFSGFRECFVLGKTLPVNWIWPDSGFKDKLGFTRTHELEKMILEINKVLDEEVSLSHLKLIREENGAGRVVRAVAINGNSCFATFYKARLDAVEGIAQEQGQWVWDDYQLKLLYLSFDHKRLLGVVSSREQG